MRAIERVVHTNSIEGVFTPKKEWVQIALAAASAASSLLGGLGSSSAAKKAMHAENSRKASSDAWFNKRYSEKALDTASGQATIQRAREILDEQTGRTAGQSAVSGSTTGATAAAKESANRTLGSTISNMEAQHDARKDALLQQHMEDDRQHAQTMQNYESQRSQGIAQAAAGASNALLSAASAMGKGAAGSKTSNTGGSAPTTPADNGLGDASKVYTVGNGTDAPEISGTVDDWRKQIGV